MKQLVRGVASRILRVALHVVLGGLAVVVVVFAYYLQSRPALSPWHLADLDEEFTAGSATRDFAAYLALEDRLFAQLDQQLYAQVPAGPGQTISRYSRASLSDPGRWPRNWNRSFELRREAPVTRVLLLHGLSDSPYSLRALGQRLHRAGASVLGLRVPGHGTAPSGLVHVRWEDMAAAVRLAVRHLGATSHDSPLYLVGYSNGGGLAVEYALSALEDSSLPRPDGIVLLSPEIGVSELAVLAAWQRRLGYVLGLEKLGWSDIQPEYDPFKYNSFAINAGDVAYQLTRRIQAQLDGLAGTAALERMPTVLAFQSAVDATVSAPELVEHLLDRLPPAGHELVLFDINRQKRILAMLAADPKDVFEPLLRTSARGFALTVVTNVNQDDPQVVALTSAHSGEAVSKAALDERWPQDVYSLAHIALPFRPDDPVYGGPRSGESPGVKLGDVALRGERGVLRVSAKDMLRMHWNPFYGYLESRVLEFVTRRRG